MIQKHLTLYSQWRTLAELEPGKQILGDYTRWLTAEEVLSLSEHLAGQFLTLGIHPGDYVALRADRNIAAILALIALRAIGAIVMLIDPRIESASFLADTPAEYPIRALVEATSDWFYSVSTNEAEKHFHLLALPPVHFTPVSIEVDSPAFVVFIQESVGNRKTVVLSESNIIDNLNNTASPELYYCIDDIVLGAQPMDQVLGLELICGVAMLCYAMYLPQMTDVPSLLFAIEKEHITCINGDSSLFLALCEQKDSYDISSLRIGFIFGGAVTELQLHSIEETLKITLIPVRDRNK